MMRREDLEKLEAATLAPYAMKSGESRGRDYGIRPDTLRTEFQRDRDRVIHSTSFRKLESKTQVHIISAGDYYRTRITHTMEVAQIARTLSRALRLNQDLAEAIALAHDFGHTPFGHAGEEGMREVMKDHGGFEHNEQGLRTVEVLEERSPNYPGLNLTFEVREGIIKHDTDYDKPTTDPRFLPGKMPTLESQVCDLADEIAYNNADLDDALKMGLIEAHDLKAVPWVADLFDRARADLGPDTPQKLVTYRAVGHLYEAHVSDALKFAEAGIAAAKVNSVDDVRNQKGRLVDFSQEFKDRISPLKKFLLARVYFHPKTLRNSMKAKRLVAELARAYLADSRLLPWKFQKRIEKDGAHRVVCDYISGMTDRYFNEQYVSIFLPEQRG